MLRLIPFAVLLFLAGCDATSVGEAQRLFEFDALGVPSGFTETDADGRVVRADPADWRTAPIYDSRFFLTFNPYPNPVAATESIQFAASFTGSSGGVYPYLLTSQGILDPIPVTTGSTTGTAPLFSIPAGQLGVPGLHRIVLLDFSGRIVSYGDIQLIP